VGPKAQVKKVFTNGVFDLFHEGHLNLLRKAKAEGAYLLVGVASDEACAESKRKPWQSWEVRARVVSEVPFVDDVIKTPWSADLTRDFYARHGISVQVQGDRGSSFALAEELGILKIVGRTEGISTTKLVNILRMVGAEILEGGYLNDVKRVFLDGEYYVVKHGNRIVARKYPVTLPDNRTRDEYNVITAFRQRISNAGFIVKPIGFDQEKVIVFESAPLEAETLFQILMKGGPDEALLAGIIENLVLIHNATLNDDQLQARFGSNDGFLQIKIGIQCLRATADPALLTCIEAFIAESLKIQKVLLHGDFAPKNILVWPGGHLFIDFEESGYGDPALDVGYLLAHLHIHSVLDRGRCWDGIIERLLTAYVGTFKGDDTGLVARINKYVGIFLISRLDSEAPADYIPCHYRDDIRSMAERLIL
jgi:cytidyltransferase-like protein